MHQGTSEAAEGFIRGITLMMCVSDCSINTAWLSVASSVAALVVPSAYHVHSGTEIVAVMLAVLITAVGAYGPLLPASPSFSLPRFLPRPAARSSLACLRLHS